MTGALEGIRVVDFGQYIAGPVTAMLLADHGADVIRVDPPGGPRWDVPANAAWNRGKRSIALDLKQPDDLATVRSLIATADVVIENFRPGVMERLGLGLDALREQHPRLVTCSLPGFAADDPRAAFPAWEGVVAAATDTYRPPRDGDGPPIYTAIPIASMFAAFTAAVAIAAALIDRNVSGAGQRVEAPLFDSMFAAIGANGARVQGGAAGGRPNDFIAGTYRCADGEWVQIALAKPHFYQHLVEAVPSLAARYDPERLRHDAGYRADLARDLPDLFAERPAHEWEAIGITANLPLIRVRSAAEWIASEHAVASGTVVPVDDPVYGSMWQPGSPLRTAGSRDRQPSPAPALDADRASVLDEAHATTATHIATGETPKREGALDGIRVLDLSLVLAGPVTGRTLGEFGAEVIKINPPHEEGAGIWFNRHRYHTDVNRGKQSILLDLKTPDGLATLWRLLDGADVVIHNFRPGVMERLGIDYETARARKPGIIYAEVAAYGTPGPWSHLPAYEPFGQAAPGMSRRQGGDGRPLMQPFPVNDYGTGLCAAIATLFALIQRERTGEGQQVQSALTYTGTFLQLPHLLTYAGKRWDEPHGPRALGTSALQRLYEANDGWFFLGASAAQRETVASVAGVAASSDDAEFAEALAQRIANEPVAYWCAALTGAGVGAHRLVELDELMFDPWVVEHGLSVTRTHDDGEVITTTGPGARLARTPVTAGRPAPTPGSDEAAILALVEP